MAVAGAIAGVVGSVVSTIGTFQGINAQQDAVSAQMRAEKLRETQMKLDVRRQKRDAVRRANVARGMAINAAATQGGIGGSGIKGGINQITGEQLRTRTQLQQNMSVGKGIFGANMDYYEAMKEYYASQQLAAIGGGISSLGSAMINVSGAFSRIGG